MKMSAENCHSDIEHISTATPNKVLHKLVVYLNKVTKLSEFYTKLIFFKKVPKMH
jgi:hypothetical protein